MNRWRFPPGPPKNPLIKRTISVQDKSEEPPTPAPQEVHREEHHEQQKQQNEEDEAQPASEQEEMPVPQSAEETPPKKKQEEQNDGKRRKPPQEKGSKRKRKWAKVGGGAGPSEVYKRYVFRVMKQVHPYMGISSKAMTVINNLMGDMFQGIAAEASTLSKDVSRTTLSSREIQDAVKLVLPGELGKHAIAEGTKAVTTYLGAVNGQSKSKPKPK